jgi:hypothetical protein
MLLRRGVLIEPSTTPVNELPRKTGQQVADEIGRRYLLRYLLPHQVGSFISGSQNQHYVTPTPYAPEETIFFLALPAPTQPRPYVLVLDPEQIDHILGPQWIRGAPGIQYILPHGFPQKAIVVPGAPGAAWEIQVK